VSIPVKENVKISDLQHADMQHPTHGRSAPATTGQEKTDWSGRQDSNPETDTDNQELARQDSQGASQNPYSVLDPDLQPVIAAWDKLPVNLRTAVIAIVSSSHGA
jgi:hypothetical protein